MREAGAAFPRKHCEPAASPKAALAPRLAAGSTALNLGGASAASQHLVASGAQATAFTLFTTQIAGKAKRSLVDVGRIGRPLPVAPLGERVGVIEPAHYSDACGNAFRSVEYLRC